MHQILRIACTIAVLLVLALPASAREIDLATAWSRSDVVVVAQVLDPASDLVDLPVKGQPPFQRQIRLYATLKTLRGKAPARLRVDDAGWRAQWQAQRACAGRKDCALPVVDRYRGTLSREPVPGNRVLLFLKRTHDGLELTASLAIDAATREADLPVSAGKR